MQRRFGRLSVAASRFWLPLNWGELTGNYRDYPDQYYFMSMGPRMTMLSYSIMLALTLLMALVVWRLGRTRPPVPDRRGAPALP